MDKYIYIYCIYTSRLPRPLPRLTPSSPPPPPEFLDFDSESDCVLAEVFSLCLFHKSFWSFGEVPPSWGRPRCLRQILNTCLRLHSGFPFSLPCNPQLPCTARWIPGRKIPNSPMDLQQIPTGILLQSDMETSRGPQPISVLTDD